MSLDRCWLLTKDPCFPRVSGDEPNHGLLDALKNLFSPRERG